MRFAVKNRGRLVRNLTVAAGIIFILYIINAFIFPLPENKLHRPSASFIYSREGHLLNCFTSADFYWRKPVTLDRISPLLVGSVITSEDRWFYYHPGFNPVSLIEAAIANLKAGKTVRGGSTITMQIARMMEPKPRTIGSKMIEIIRAIQLEMNYSKKELLEIYFNMVPYGGNIEGVGAAAYFYFDKPPGKLSLSEAAILTAVPAAPSEFRPDKDMDGCRARRNRVLTFLRKRNAVTESDYQAALAEEIPSMRIAPPAAAPHFCQYAASRYRDRSEIVSTIDFHIQTICEQLALRHHLLISAKQINNLAVIVLDNRSGDILAMVGSPKFDDIAHGGQINGTLSRRSPGSALKPFVYALGFENGLISPEMKIEDIPINYSGYIPENYDEEYHGMVSVKEALIQSLNVPAVNITSQVGLKNLYDFLVRSGITTLNRNYYDYGLPLILGAGEVNLLELTNLYATLGRKGYYRPFRAVPDDDTTGGIRVLSEETCFIVTDILADLQRPDFPSTWEFTATLPKIAWKTGTSYGRKDAWAVGCNPVYSVGVWTGNFSGEGSVDIVGAEIAAPLMLDIFNEICRGKSIDWFAEPDGIAAREVCTASGKPLGDACRQSKYEYYIPGISPAGKCDIHRKFVIDKKTGFALCPYCLAGKETREEIVEQWPPRVAGWMKISGQYHGIPSHNPLCIALTGGDQPTISSPEKDALYVLSDYQPKEFQKILFDAAVPSGSRQVHWFLDNVLYKTVPAGERLFYQPERGRHTLLCLDDQGRSSSVQFEVR